MIIYGQNDESPANVEKIEDFLTRLPLAGDNPLFVFTTGRDNAIDFMKYFCDIFKRSSTEFEETIFSTYNINQDAAELFEHYKKNNILSGKTYVLFNDVIMRLGDDRPEFIKQALNAAPGLEWRTANSHAKLQLYKSGDHHFVIEGSGNLAENSNLEFYTIHNNKRLYDFRRSLIMAFFGIKPAEASPAKINLNHIGRR